MAKAPVKPSKIVEATGIAATIGGAGTKAGPSVAARVEQAMADAVRKAIADGITDPAKQRELMLAAKKRVVSGA